MKGKILLFSFLWLLTVLNAQAQAEEVIDITLNNESNRKHIIKTNLLSVLTQAASLSYENVLSHKSGIQVGAYYGKSYILGDVERVSFTAQYRRYFPKEENILVGMYLAPYLKYQQITDSEETLDESLTAKAEIRTFGGGLIIGRQWIAKKGFTVDMYAGAGYNPRAKLQSVKLADVNHPYTFSERRWQRDVTLGLVIGFAF